MKPFWTTFRYTFIRFRGQILGWGLGIASLGLILVPFYDIFMDQQEDFMKMLDGYPPEFLAFFGGDKTSMLTPEGYLGMYGFSMLPVIIGIFAVLAGSGLLVGDEERGRLDLILSHPVGRSSFFFGRAFAFIGATIAVLLIAWLGFSVLLGGSTMGVTWGQMALPFLPLLMQALIYGTLALLLSMLLPSRNMAAMLSALVMVASYFISSMASLNESLATISQIFPYAYYQGAEAMTNLNMTWLFGLLGVCLVMVMLAWWRFLRRDIRLSGEGSLRFWFSSPLRRKKVESV